MIRIDDPIPVGDTLFLRTTSSEAIVRLPSPPVVLRPTEGTPAAALELFRASLEQDDGVDLGPMMSGGVVTCLLDLGASNADRAGRETQLPSDLPPRVLSAPLTGGTVSVFFGDERVAQAAIPALRRPIVPLTVTVDQNAASLIRTVIQDGRSGPFAIAAEGGIAVRRDGPTSRLSIDFDRVARALPAGEALTAGAAVAAIDELLSQGIVTRTIMAVVPDPRPDLLDRATIAQAIFEPVAGGATSFIPGIALDGYSPSGKVRPRDRRGVIELTLEGAAASLPWFASSLLDLTGALIRLDDLPEPAIDLVVIVPVFVLPAGTDAIAVEVEMHGDRRSLTLGPGAPQHVVRFVRPENADHSYRCRTGHVAGGATTWGGWITSDTRIRVVDAVLRSTSGSD